MDLKYLHGMSPNLRLQERFALVEEALSDVEGRRVDAFLEQTWRNIQLLLQDLCFFFANQATWATAAGHFESERQRLRGLLQRAMTLTPLSVDQRYNQWFHCYMQFYDSESVAETMARISSFTDENSSSS